MLEPGSRARLALEALDHSRRPRDIGPQHLHREPALELFVPDLVDLGEPSRSYEPLHFVLCTESAGELREGV